jgi:hypothetical protein
MPKYEVTMEFVGISYEIEADTDAQAAAIAYGYLDAGVEVDWTATVAELPEDDDEDTP